MKYVINVTADHIRRGKRCQTDSCPIALACKDAKMTDFFSVNSLGIGLKSSRERHPLPKEAKDFLCKYDCSFKVEPFSFEMEIP